MEKADEEGLDGKMATRIWGWFSDEMAKDNGYVIYESVSGDPMNVTAVTEGESPVDPSKGCAKDMIMVGELKEIHIQQVQ